MTCGTTLRDRRLALGLTQDQLAEQSGVSRRTIQRAELGTHRPHRPQLRALAAILGIHLVDGEPVCADAHPPDGGAATDESPANGDLGEAA